MANKPKFKVDTKAMEKKETPAMEKKESPKMKAVETKMGMYSKGGKVKSKKGGK